RAMVVEAVPRLLYLLEPLDAALMRELASERFVPLPAPLAAREQRLDAERPRRRGREQRRRPHDHRRERGAPRHAPPALCWSCSCTYAVSAFTDENARLPTASSGMVTRKGRSIATASSRA